LFVLPKKELLEAFVELEAFALLALLFVPIGRILLNSGMLWLILFAALAVACPTVFSTLDVVFATAFTAPLATFTTAFAVTFTAEFNGLVDCPGNISI
jgi:hypothetical protein